MNVRWGNVGVPVEIQEFLKNELHLTDPKQLRQLMEDAKMEYIPAGTFLVRSGELQACIPFLLDGVFRGFLVDEEGRDITDCFACRRGDILMGCNELGTPSSISIEAVTDGLVLFLSVESVMKQMASQVWLLQKYNDYLIDALRRHWEEKMLLNRCQAMQRYLWFLKTYPGLIDVVSNKHVASFLGMTPVTLSRLRRQMRKDLDAPE